MQPSAYDPQATVRFRAHGAEIDIAWLTIDLKLRHNIVSMPLIDKLMAALDEIRANEKARVLILTGAGDKAFIGGADINEMVNLDENSAREYITKLHLFCKALREFPVPVIARICGYCLGAGLEIAASCDIRVSADNGSFGMPEVNVGIPSVIEAAILPRLIGWGRCRELLLTGETVGAYDALSMGLVERVTPIAKLNDTVDEIANAIASRAPGAIRLQKELIRRWESLPLDESIELGIDYFAQAYRSGEPQAHMNRFLDRIREKRKERQATETPAPIDANNTPSPS